MRKVISIDDKRTNRKFSIYRNAEYSEWVVRFYEGDVHLADADYHTGDKTDAYDTANKWLSPQVESDPLIPFAVV